MALSNGIILSLFVMLSTGRLHHKYLLVRVETTNKQSFGVLNVLRPFAISLLLLKTYLQMLKIDKFL